MGTKIQTPPQAPITSTKKTPALGDKFTGETVTIGNIKYTPYDTDKDGKTDWLNATTT